MKHEPALNFVGKAGMGVKRNGQLHSLLTLQLPFKTGNFTGDQEFMRHRNNIGPPFSFCGYLVRKIVPHEAKEIFINKENNGGYKDSCATMNTL